MFESIILGIVQGVAEWLPVSSEGLIFLIKTNFFPKDETLTEIFKLALFLHFGTFLAALVYFRKDVWLLLKAIFDYKKLDKETRDVLDFLIITTIISGFLGLLFIKILDSINFNINSASRVIALLIGLLLLVTAFLQFKVNCKKRIIPCLANKESGRLEINKRDGIILGIIQSLAVLPGLSRSGLTVSTLLIRKVDESLALKLSFLMSLPIVLGGNIILNLDKFSLSPEFFVALSFSFVFGLITIDLLLRLAKKVNFAIFVLIFAILTIASAFVF